MVKVRIVKSKHRLTLQIACIIALSSGTVSTLLLNTIILSLWPSVLCILLATCITIYTLPRLKHMVDEDVLINYMAIIREFNYIGIRHDYKYIYMRLLNGDVIKNLIVWNDLTLFKFEDDTVVITNDEG